MLVRRKRSNKRKRKFYEALEFTYYSLDIEEVKEFLGNLGKVEIKEKDNILYGTWIETRDGRKICIGQYLLKDDRRERILSFDATIFYDWFERINHGPRS